MTDFSGEQLAEVVALDLDIDLLSLYQATDKNPPPVSVGNYYNPTVIGERGWMLLSQAIIARDNNDVAILVEHTPKEIEELIKLAEAVDEDVPPEFVVTPGSFDPITNSPDWEALDANEIVWSQEDNVIRNDDGSIAVATPIVLTGCPELVNVVIQAYLHTYGSGSTMMGLVMAGRIIDATNCIGVRVYDDNLDVRQLYFGGASTLCSIPNISRFPIPYHVRLSLRDGEVILAVSDGESIESTSGTTSTNLTAGRVGFLQHQFDIGPGFQPVMSDFSADRILEVTPT